MAVDRLDQRVARVVVVRAGAGVRPTPVLRAVDQVRRVAAQSPTRVGEDEVRPLEPCEGVARAVGEVARRTLCESITLMIQNAATPRLK